MHGVSHLARATSRPRDENYNANAQKPSVATPETPKLRLELLGLPEETCFRKMVRYLRTSLPACARWLDILPRGKVET